MPVVKPAGRNALTVRSVLMSCREHYAFATLFTMLFSLLMLTYPIFMMQVYQRVIPAKSWETLVTLCIGLLIALAAKAAFQWVRGLLLVRVSARFEKSLADRLLRVVIRQSANGTGPANAQLLRDLDSVRQFASGKGAVAILDLPFGFMFLAVLFALDATIGTVALILEGDPDPRHRASQRDDQARHPPGQPRGRLVPAVQRGRRAHRRGGGRPGHAEPRRRPLAPGAGQGPAGTGHHQQPRRRLLVGHLLGPHRDAGRESWRSGRSRRWTATFPSA